MLTKLLTLYNEAIFNDVNNICVFIIGRTISIRLQDGNDGDYSALLTAAIDSKFDWVFYENSNTVRLSVIPSSKLQCVITKFTYSRTFGNCIPSLG